MDFVRGFPRAMNDVLEVIYAGLCKRWTCGLVYICDEDRATIANLLRGGYGLGLRSFGSDKSIETPVKFL